MRTKLSAALSAAHSEITNAIFNKIMSHFAHFFIATCKSANLKENLTFYCFIINEYFGGSQPRIKDEITIKTPKLKCRLHWCLIEFIGSRSHRSLMGVKGSFKPANSNSDFNRVYKLEIQSVMLVFSISILKLG
jgi:hypothetical protein